MLIKHMYMHYKVILWVFYSLSSSIYSLIESKFIANIIISSINAIFVKLSCVFWINVTTAFITPIVNIYVKMNRL